MDGHGVVGFRFHPTEEEIITYFLERKMCGLDFPAHTIADVVDVCKYEPWELPQRSSMPKEDRVWYFFNAPVPKYANSKRVNRTTNSGFWKPTGKDRVILDELGKKIGFKKNLVFHKGRVPNGTRTNWVMHEYHSHNASSYPKEFVLFRLKKKSGDKPDACNEQTPQRLASDSGNRAIEATNPQMNLDLSEEWQILLSDTELDYNLLADSNGLHDNIFSELPSNIQPEQGTSINASGFDHNTLPAFLSMVRPVNSNGFDHNSLSSLLSEHGTSYPDGVNNEPSFLNDYCLETSEQEDDFVNSLLADEVECSGERRTNTLRHDFNPTISKIYEQNGKVLGTSNVFYEKPRAHMGTGWALSETSSSSEGYGIMDFDISSVNSDTDLPGIVGRESVVDELQHTPKYHKYFEMQCSTQELQTERKVSNKAVSKVEMGEAVHHAVDLPRTEKATVRFVKDKKMAQKTKARKNSNSSCNGCPSSNKKELYISSLTAASDGAGSSNKKSSLISPETPQLSHKTDPPSVYLFRARL